MVTATLICALAVFGCALLLCCRGLYYALKQTFGDRTDPETDGDAVTSEEISRSFDFDDTKVVVKFTCTGRRGQSKSEVDAALAGHEDWQAKSLSKMIDHEYEVTDAGEDEAKAKTQHLQRHLRLALKKAMKALHGRLTRSVSDEAEPPEKLVADCLAECLHFKVVASLAEQALHAPLQLKKEVERGRKECTKEKKGLKEFHYSYPIDLEKLHAKLDEIHKKGSMNFDDLNDCHRQKFLGIIGRNFQESSSWYGMAARFIPAGLLIL